MAVFEAFLRNRFRGRLLGSGFGSERSNYDPGRALFHQVLEQRCLIRCIPVLQLLRDPGVLCTSELGKVRAARLHVGHGSSMVEKVVQCSLELVVEVFEVGVLIDMQIEEVTKDVMVVFKLESVITLIQCLDHL